MWRMRLAPACWAVCRRRTQPPTTAARRRPATWAARAVAAAHPTATPGPQPPLILRIRIPTRLPCTWILHCLERVSIHWPLLLCNTTPFVFVFRLINSSLLKAILLFKTVVNVYTVECLGSYSSVVGGTLHHAPPMLTPSLVNYVRSDLTGHVTGWPADILEKQVCWS